MGKNPRNSVIFKIFWQLSEKYRSKKNWQFWPQNSKYDFCGFLPTVQRRLHGFWEEHIFFFTILHYRREALSRNSRTISTRVLHGHMETLFFSYVYIASIMHKCSSSSQPRFILLENLGKKFHSYQTTKSVLLKKSWITKNIELF